MIINFIIFISFNFSTKINCLQFTRRAEVRRYEANLLSNLCENALHFDVTNHDDEEGNTRKKNNDFVFLLWMKKKVNFFFFTFHSKHEVLNEDENVFFSYFC